MQPILKFLCALTCLTCLTAVVLAGPWVLDYPSNPPTPTVEDNIPIDAGGSGPASDKYTLKIRLVDDPMGKGWYLEEERTNDKSGSWSVHFGPPPMGDPHYGQFELGENKFALYGPGEGGGGTEYAIVNVINPP